MDTLLDQITSPRDLRGLTPAELERLAAEIRSRITDVVAAHGGHLASNLGIVELTLALHRAYDFSADHLVFDVGHQCYAHKLVTGRQEAFEDLRTAGGTSGFPNPEECPEYDRFRTGHAGASISTATGLALAERAAGSGRRTVAVIGDGSLASGLALEGLNHAGDVEADLLVILNDNQMAISPTVGALSRYLTAVRSMPTYDQVKADVHDMLRRVPLGDAIEQAIHGVKDSLKALMVPDHALEHFGFRCFGPVDGHDLDALAEAIEEMKGLAGPRLLHVHTRKGEGFSPASEKPADWHSAKPFTEKNGEIITGPPPGGATWTRAAVDALLARGEDDERIDTVTAAMPEGTGLLRFGHRWPDRFYDVGICEQHAVAMAAGLARGGRRPVVAIYSTFLQRAYDQVFHEIALQGLPVVFLVDRAGLVGADGPTHHGLYDLAYLRHLPGMTVAAPADRAELEGMLKAALAADGPWAIRYPRDLVPERTFAETAVEPGRGAVVREGEAGAVLAFGAGVAPAVEAAERLAKDGIDLTVASARFAKPLDAELIERLFAEYPFVLTVEDAARPGGFGAAVCELAAEAGSKAGKVRIAAVDDVFVQHAARGAQLEAQGLTAPALADRLRELAEEAI